MSSAFKGLFISSILAIIFYAVFFMGFPIKNTLTKEIIIFYFVPFLVIGFIQGLFAHSMFADRFKKLFLLSLFLVFITCLVYSTIMILSDPTYSYKNPQTWIDILKLGGMGFVIFGIITLPFSLIGTFLVELWTNRKF